MFRYLFDLHFFMLLEYSIIWRIPGIEYIFLLRSKDSGAYSRMYTDKIRQSTMPRSRYTSRRWQIADVILTARLRDHFDESSNSCEVQLASYASYTIRVYTAPAKVQFRYTFHAIAYQRRAKVVGKLRGSRLRRSHYLKTLRGKTV